MIRIFFNLIVCLLIGTACMTETLIAAENQNLTRTPSDFEGPFYPVVRQQDEDNDLIHVKGRSQSAQGAILHLSGKIMNTEGEPVHDARVEIWQTDSNGLYNDRRDTSPGKRDPDFQYWGEAATKADGTFTFTTIVPGKYEPRPAHIHYKVWINDTLVLTSQIYFTNHPEEKNVSYRTDPLQTVELIKTKKGDFRAYIQIIL